MPRKRTKLEKLIDFYVHDYLDWVAMFKRIGFVGSSSGLTCTVRLIKSHPTKELKRHVTHAWLCVTNQGQKRLNRFSGTNARAALIVNLYYGHPVGDNDVRLLPAREGYSYTVDCDADMRSLGQQLDKIIGTLKARRFESLDGLTLWGSAAFRKLLSRRI